MKGIDFVVDEAGNRKAVVIDLAEHGDLWEDFYDILVAQQREGDLRETLAEVKERLASLVTELPPPRHGPLAPPSESHGPQG